MTTIAYSIKVVACPHEKTHASAKNTRLHSQVRRWRRELDDQYMVVCRHVVATQEAKSKRLKHLFQLVELANTHRRVAFAQILVEDTISVAKPFTVNAKRSVEQHHGGFVQYGAEMLPEAFA